MVPKSLVKVLMRNVAMSYSPPGTEEASCKGCRWLCGKEDDGKSEWLPVTGSIRVQYLLGTKVS
jgi:hypothetical protein